MKTHWKVDIQLGNAENEIVINEFLLNLKNENKKARTQRGYKYILQDFFKERKVSYLLITSNDINNFIEEHRKIRKENTIRTYLTGLSSFYSFCVEKQYMETRPIKDKKSNERYWETNISISNDENQKLLNSFLISLKESNKRKSTIVNVREFLQSFLKTRDEKISALTSNDIKDYFEVNKINSTKEKVNITYIHSFINFCVEKCNLEKSTNIEMILKKGEEILKKYWVVNISLSNQNNEEVLNEYLLSMKIMNYSKDTILLRRDFLQFFFREDEEVFLNLKSNEILEKITKISKGKKEKTISNYISNLKCLYSFCIEEGYLEISPIKSRWFPRLPQPVPKYLEKEEVVKVQQRMEKENIRNRALFEFLLTSGCRIGEVHNIDRENIDFEKRTVLVLGKGRKYRQVHFSEKCSLLLERYLESRKDKESALFVTLNGDFNRLSANTMRKLLVKLGKELGLRGSLHPHRLRHTFATDLLAKGAELSFIADELGHSNLMTTQVYARLPKREIISMYRKKSVKLYLLSVKQLMEHSGKSIDTINKKHVRLWLYYLSEKGYKPKTISTKLGGLNTFFTYCCEEGILSTNPVVGISIQKEESKPSYLSLTDLTKLRQLINKCFLAERAIIEVLYATGMRISELSNMRREDIYWNERIIQIQKGKRKKGRIVLFTKECEVHLKAYLDTRMDDFPYVFVSPRYADRPIRISYVGKIFKEIYSKQLGFRVTPHTLRHTFAAHLAQKGMPFDYIQILLGHEDPQQTRHYARLYNHARKELYDEFI